MTKLSPVGHFALIGMQLLNLAAHASARDIPVMPISVVVDTSLAVQALSDEGVFTDVGVSEYTAESLPALTNSLDVFKEVLTYKEYEISKSNIALLYYGFLSRCGNVEADIKCTDMIAVYTRLIAEAEEELLRKNTTGSMELN
jgi:hypothetical protein